MVDLLVDCAAFHQLFVCALGGDTAVFEDKNLVSIEHSVDALGNDEGGAVAHQPLQRLLNLSLGLHVDGAGAVVEDQDAALFAITLAQSNGDRVLVVRARQKPDRPRARRDTLGTDQHGKQRKGALALDFRNPDRIDGYAQDEYTHLAIAAAVSSGKADCGLGIAAAAQALDLDFVPLFEERYDLVIPEEHYNNDLLDPLFKILDDPAFRQAVKSLPGYDISPMGKLISDIK